VIWNQNECDSITAILIPLLYYNKQNILHTRVLPNDDFSLYRSTQSSSLTATAHLLLFIIIIVVNFCGNLMYLYIQYVEQVLFALIASRCVFVCVRARASAFRKQYLGRLRVWVIMKIYVYIVAVEHVSHCRERR